MLAAYLLFQHAPVECSFQLFLVIVNILSFASLPNRIFVSVIHGKKTPFLDAVPTLSKGVSCFLMSDVGIIHQVTKLAR